MAKEIDALVLMGHAYQISREAPRYLHEDVGQGLWYVRSGKTQWYNSKPITEQDKTNLYASEAFLGLGDLAAMRFFGHDAYITSLENPYTQKAVETINDISPLQAGETLDILFNIQAFRRSKITRALLKKSLSIQNEDEIEELNRKWAVAQNVQKRRGMTVISAYDIDELISGVGGVDTSSVAPDIVVFDSNGSVASESYSLEDLVDKAQVQAKPTKVPYFFAFTQESAPEMLADALDDMRQVKYELDALR